MKVELLISLVLALTVPVGAMTCEDDTCKINEDTVQVRTDSVQLSDPAQGYIFDRDTTGWIVNHCYVPPANLRPRPLTFTPIDGKKVFRQPQRLMLIYRDSCGRVDSCGRLESKSWNFIISD
jgi:hypothetical protein